MNCSDIEEATLLARDPARWRQVEQFYRAALEREPSQRVAYLSELCRGDNELRGEVESLLKQGNTEVEPLLGQEFSIRTPVDRSSCRTAAGGPDQPASSLAEGTRLGPYRIEALLGAGGMGEVYRARDSRLERLAAVKVLHPALAGQPDFRKRFLREARAVAALNHGGIAAIYEAGESLDCLYLAMEYVAGRTLEQELASGPVSTGRLIDYSLQIAGAMDHAHARGILHRDIKPGNVMVNPDGVVKVLDFGLAKEILPTDETAINFTTPGTIVGTLHYCPPEVLTGRPATVRSDLYSLGHLSVSWNRNLVEDFARGCDGLDEDGVVVGNRTGNPMKVANRQREEFAKRTGVFDNSEDRAPGAVPAQAASAPFARAAGKIDFADDALGDPRGIFGIGHFAHKFVPRSSRESVITALELEVGGANAGD